MMDPNGKAEGKKSFFFFWLQQYVNKKIGNRKLSFCKGGLRGGCGGEFQVPLRDRQWKILVQYVKVERTLKEMICRSFFHWLCSVPRKTLLLFSARKSLRSAGMMISIRFQMELCSRHVFLLSICMNLILMKWPFP